MSFLALMHPSAALLLWLFATLACQLARPLALLPLALLLLGGAAKPWWGFICRARWLLISLWLIMAYSLPGDALFDLSWLPTWQGAASANEHVLRVLLILGVLATLLKRVPHSELLFGLWWLFKPFGRGTERLVVRLALVLEAVDTSVPRRPWQEILRHPVPIDADDGFLRFQVRAWQTPDTVKLLLFSALLAVMVWA